MPPVFGPSSPSQRRLKSCAGVSGSTSVPSQRASSDTSGPLSASSITTASPELPKTRETRHRSAATRASARSAQTVTPLPAASPSAFTTTAPGCSSSAASTSASVRHRRWRAVGTPAAAMTSLANAFEPSSRAASAPGPKTGIPAWRSASASPATSGASGPITTSPASTPRARSSSASPSSARSGWHEASRAIPGLPGAQCRSSQSGLAASATASACSRPPEPTSRTFTGSLVSGIARRDGPREAHPRARAESR